MNRARHLSAGMAALYATLAAGALAILYFFEPGRVAVYPVCVLYTTTNLLCPGCGGLRAAHQLLHGNIGAAFQLNPLLIVLIPAGAWWLGHRVLRPGSPGVLTRYPAAPWVLLAVVVLFGLLRNLPLAFASALR